MGAPWLKFFPADWRSDPALRSCSIAARGLWMEMLCLMHEAAPRGSLLINGHKITDKQLANLAGISLSDIGELLEELLACGVYSVEDDGTIFSRRMRQDTQKAEEDKANGRKGGNPNLNGGVNPRDNPRDNPNDKAQKPEARSHIPDKNQSSLRSDSAKEPKTAKRDPRGERLPEDFNPDTMMAVEQLGVARTDEELARFRDYWRAKGGKDGRKLDWDATWRNWVRTAVERTRARSPPSRGGGFAALHASLTERLGK